ncbi:unnamed protein product, partial [Timema podura]|nr:unnamed protein product [Timema podura]
RAYAAAWLKKLQSINDKNLSGIRNNYIKLLLFSLQRRRLLGIFKKLPDQNTQLEPFPDDASVLDMTRKFTELDITAPEEIQASVPPYIVEVSSDLKEYAVAQEIPNFGVHCYFAVSNDPISEWDNAEKGLYPRVPPSLALGPSWDDTSSVITTRDDPSKPSSKASLFASLKARAALRSRSKKSLQSGLTDFQICGCPEKREPFKSSPFEYFDSESQNQMYYKLQEPQYADYYVSRKKVEQRSNYTYYR